MTPSQIKEFFSLLAADRPNPRIELDYTNPYTLLVAVVLSAQSTDVGVNKATASLFREVTTPAQMLALGVETLRERVKTIGLFNTKAANIMALSQMLVDKFNGEVPSTREELQSLPGVGRKSANVLLNTAFGQPVLGVDTHIFRVAHRTGLADGKTPEAVEAQLMAVIPKNRLLHAHHWLVLHGRYTCKARAPACDHCPVRHLCPSATPSQTDDL